jgi:hypothetical protein
MTEMDTLVSRSERLINALTGAIMTTAEVAAEKIEMASEVARIKTRMAAFATVLEVVGVQKDTIREQIATARGPVKALLEAQLTALTQQEVGILAKVGVSPEAAATAVTVADQPRRRRQNPELLDGATLDGGIPMAVSQRINGHKAIEKTS